jgi:hypothetical protein
VFRRLKVAEASWYARSFWLLAKSAADNSWTNKKLRLLRAFYALLEKRLIPNFCSLNTQATRAAELSGALFSTRSRLHLADALITELRAKEATHAKNARFMKEREDVWKRERDEKERMRMEMMEVMEQTKHYKALLAKRIGQVRSQRETIKHLEECLRRYRDVECAEESRSELVGESLVVMPDDYDMDMDAEGVRVHHKILMPRGRSSHLISDHTGRL